MIQIRPMQPGEEADVIRLIRSVFDRYVAPYYTPEGVTSFYRYADEHAMQVRKSSHTVLAAEIDGELIGILEMRGDNHLAMLFVDPDWQHKGVGTALFEEAMKLCLSANPNLELITVHSFSNAVEFYHSLGFEITQPEQEIDGIRFTSMTLDLWR